MWLIPVIDEESLNELINLLSCSQAVKQDTRIHNWNKSWYWSCLCRYFTSE